MQTRRTSRVARSTGLAVALLLMAGCASETGTEDAASTGSASATSSSPAEETAAGTSAPAESTADAPAFPADTSPDSAAPVDPAGLTVTAIRSARQDGYDRVVFELSGTGTPGWQVEYVDAPSAQGTGDAVDVPGEAYLQVTLQGTTYPYESGAEEVSRGAVAASDTQTVEGVVYDATFEGASLAWIGTGAEVPFRVYSLTGPSRVVVEVVDAG